MKQRSFIQGVTLYVTPTMFQMLRQLSDNRKESVSETIRGMIEKCLDSPNQTTKKEDQKDG